MAVLGEAMPVDVGEQQRVFLDELGVAEVLGRAYVLGQVAQGSLLHVVGLAAEQLVVALDLAVGQDGEQLVVALVLGLRGDLLLLRALDEDALVGVAKLLTREAGALEQLAQHAVVVAAPPVVLVAHALGELGVELVVGHRLANGLDQLVVDRDVGAFE